MGSKNKTSVVIVLLLLAYFLFRVVNLSMLPIFNDESTYIRYGLHQLEEPDHQLYSLLIGKEPLLPFLYAFIGTSVGNLLLGARAVTITFGLLTLSGLFLFTKELLGKRAAFFTSLFYIISPFTVFFDRLALLDSAVSTVAVWTLYCTHRLLQKSRWLFGIVLGSIMGIGLWVKTSDLFYLFLPLISYIIYYFAKGDTNLTKGKMFLSSFVLSMIVFLPLFANPFYVVHMQLLSQYTYPIYSVFLFPFGVWWGNVTAVVEWLFFYLTPPLFLLAVGSLAWLTKQKKVWLVLLWFYLPLVYEILYAKLFTSRHVLPLTVPLLVLAGYGFSLLWQKKKVLGMVSGIIILVWTTYDNVTLLTSPQQYPLLFVDKAKADAEQYVYGYSSGYGVSEAINYLEQQAVTHHIAVYIRNDHGNPEDAVVAYLDYQNNITIVPLNDPTADTLKAFSIFKNQPQYFVSRGGYYAGLEKYFVSKKQFLKPNDTEFVGVEQLQLSEK